MTPAARLASAEAEFIEAEHAVEALLDVAYHDGWEEFEVSADEIDVYGVLPYPPAVDVLQRVGGFRLVVQHDHLKHEFRHCGCRRQGA